MTSRLSMLFGLSVKEEQIIKSLMNDLDKLEKRVPRN